MLLARLTGGLEGGGAAPEVELFGAEVGWTPAGGGGSPAAPLLPGPPTNEPSATPPDTAAWA